MPSSRGILRKLGFSDLAEAIYLKLLSRGAVSIVELAQLVGKHRPVVYQALPPLFAANLVLKTVKGRRVLYKAASPLALEVLAKSRQERVAELMPRLTKIFQDKDQKPKISFFEGREGIQAVFEQLVASTPKEGIIYRYESPREYDKNKRYYPGLYWRRAGATGDINKYVITNQETNQKRHLNLNRFSKAVSGPFAENITQIIGDNQVIFIDYDTETAILIENSRFAEFQKTLFKKLFEKL